jgi:DNA-directed RNA polymerase subunit alpha
LIYLFIPFLHAEEENFHLEKNQHKITLPLFAFHDRLAKLRKNKKEITLKSIFIEQLELASRFIIA